MAHVGPVLATQSLTERDGRLGPARLAERHGGGPGDVAVHRRQPLHDEGHRVVARESEEAGERLHEDTRIAVAAQREQPQEQADVGTSASDEAADAPGPGGGSGSTMRPTQMVSAAGCPVTTRAMALVARSSAAVSMGGPNAGSSWMWAAPRRKTLGAG